MDAIIIGVFLICIVISRILGERAYKILTNEEKTLLMDGFSGMRAYGLIPLIVTLGGWWVISGRVQLETTIIIIIYVILLVAYTVIFQIIIFNKLNKLELSKVFVKQFMLSRAVSYIGLLVFIVGIIL